MLTVYVVDCRCRKITELEEELKVVGNNMKALEIAEQEVTSRSMVAVANLWFRLHRSGASYTTVAF